MTQDGSNAIKLRALSGGRLRLVGVKPDSETERALVDWVSERSEVASFEWPRPGAFELRLVRSDATPARALAALRDRLAALRHAATPAIVHRLALVHSLPGRARFRVLEGPSETASRLAACCATTVASYESWHRRRPDRCSSATTHRSSPSSNSCASSLRANPTDWPAVPTSAHFA